MTENQKRRIEDRLPGQPLQWDEESANDEIVALHRQLAAEKLRADQGWERAEAKSKECIELREVLAQAGVRAEPAGIPAELTPMLLLNAALCIEGEGTPEKRQAIIEKLGRIAEAMHTAPTIPAQVPAAEVRRAALEEAAKACENECVEDTGHDGDRCYNLAIKHCATAIRSLAQSSTADKASEVRADDSRYPYTYAADYLRMQIGDDYGKGLISRSAASQARTLVAKAIGLPDAHVANKLADAYLAAAPSTAVSGNTGALGEGVDRG